MALTEQMELAHDVDRCALERVEIIGHIQPHGVLLALSEPDFVVRQVSANASKFFGKSPQAILGGSVEAVLGSSQFETFRSYVLSGEAISGTSFRLPGNGEELEVEWSVHRHDEERFQALTEFARLTCSIVSLLER